MTNTPNISTDSDSLRTILAADCGTSPECAECDAEAPTSREVGYFLADYVAWLMGCGATCIRIEKNVNRIARTYGKRVEITVMPRHIQMTVFDRDHEFECLTLNFAVKGCPVSYSLNTRLSELSWKISDRNLPLSRARVIFDRIVTSGSPQNPWIVLLLVTLANMSFCRLFGGDFIACGVVGAATLAGYRLKTFLLSRKADVRVVFIICAFVSAVLGCTDLLFHFGQTPAIALGTSVLYLVPGIPLLNSFSDMLNRHYICAFSRFMDAAVLTCCLSIGLCMAMLVMNVGMF